MAIERLRFTRCKVTSGKPEPLTDDDDRFEVPINPADFKRNFGISYDDEQAEKPLGKSGFPLNFNKVKSETLSFSITLDGTGVVPNTRDKPVADQVKTLRSIVYDYSGEEHEPTPVQITWGEGLKFTGRLTSMDCDYTLFDPDGLPLRVKIALSFSEFMTAVEEALKAKRNSPDMTHQVQTRAGDTLPLLCEQIYKDPGRYAEVAAFNGLDGFRAIAPGTILRFPPIRGRAS